MSVLVSINPLRDTIAEIMPGQLCESRRDRVEDPQAASAVIYRHLTRISLKFASPTRTAQIYAYIYTQLLWHTCVQLENLSSLANVHMDTGSFLITQPKQRSGLQCGGDKCMAMADATIDMHVGSKPRCVAYASLRRSTRPSVQWVGQTPVGSQPPRPQTNKHSHVPRVGGQTFSRGAAKPSPSHTMYSNSHQSACKHQAWLCFPKNRGPPSSVSTDSPYSSSIILRCPERKMFRVVD